LFGCTQNNDSALMIAVRSGRKRCVRVLLEAGCDVHTSDSVSKYDSFYVVHWRHSFVTSRTTTRQRRWSKIASLVGVARQIQL